MSDETTDPQQTDFDEDPREQETGTGGYPESTAGGTEGDQAGGGEDAGTDEQAPSQSTGKETDRGQSTGNPDAAG
jgi:hypothetical protein